MKIVSKLYTYLVLSAKAVIHKPSIHTFSSALKYFPDWYRHFDKNRSPIKDEIPWLTFGAIDFIKNVIHPDMSVFEYGSGGSTLFWSSRVQRVISIEHEKQWYDIMINKFNQLKAKNVNYYLIEPTPNTDLGRKDVADPSHYSSLDKNFVHKSFETYAKAIDSYDDESFDFVIVDGRARPSCVLHAKRKVKVSGYMIVDNTDRDYYLKAFKNNSDEWKRRDFVGPVPYNGNYSQTTIFQRLK